MKKVMLMIMMAVLLVGCSCGNRKVEETGDSQVAVEVVDSLQTPVDTVAVDTVAVAE